MHIFHNVSIISLFSVHGAVMYSTFGIFGLEVIAALMLIIAVYKVIVHSLYWVGKGHLMPFV